MHLLILGNILFLQILYCDHQNELDIMYLVRYTTLHRAMPKL